MVCAGGSRSTEALRFVEEILDRKQIDFFQRDGGVKREDSIARTIEASLDFLDQPSDRERALELGIFPAETEVPFTTVAKLWQLDDLDTELVATRLADLALDQALGDSGTNARRPAALLFREVRRAVGPSLTPRPPDRWLG